MDFKEWVRTEQGKSCLAEFRRNSLLIHNCRVPKDYDIMTYWEREGFHDFVNNQVEQGVLKPIETK